MKPPSLFPCVFSLLLLIPFSDLHLHLTMQDLPLLSSFRAEKLVVNRSPDWRKSARDSPPARIRDPSFLSRAARRTTRRQDERDLLRRRQRGKREQLDLAQLSCRPTFSHSDILYSIPDIESVLLLSLRWVHCERINSERELSLFKIFLLCLALRTNRAKCEIGRASCRERV